LIRKWEILIGVSCGYFQGFRRISAAAAATIMITAAAIAMWVLAVVSLVRGITVPLEDIEVD
jgi:hypothetical protein